MNRFIVATLLALILGTRPVQAQTDDTGLLRTCETQITAKFKQWRLAPVSKEVAEAARNSHENPTMVSGDFDADKRRDVALLIQDGPSPDPDYPRRLDSMHIAVCLNTADRVQLLLIDRPYCGDGIALAPQGQAYYDFTTEQEGVYKFDGISAYCFEKAGATYEFDGGTFQRIVDSD